MKKKAKAKELFVIRSFDSDTQIGEGEYIEFPSVAAAKKWLKEPTQVEWLHSYEISITIYKLVKV